jgi:hypothetical protein
MTSTNQLIQAEDRVVIIAPEHQNLLGLLMSNLLANNMAQDATYRRVRSLQGDVEVQAGEMIVTLRFDEGVLNIVAGGSSNAKARVKGDMTAFLNVVQGRGLVSPVLSGAIRIGGNPFTLLKLLPLLKTPNDAQPTSTVRRDTDDE